MKEINIPIDITAPDHETTREVLLQSSPPEDQKNPMSYPVLYDEITMKWEDKDYIEYYKHRVAAELQDKVDQKEMEKMALQGKDPGGILGNLFNKGGGAGTAPPPNDPQAIMQEQLDRLNRSASREDALLRQMRESQADLMKAYMSFNKLRNWLINQGPRTASIISQDYLDALGEAINAREKFLSDITELRKADGL